jgi:hypothetical protein
VGQKSAKILRIDAADFEVEFFGCDLEQSIPYAAANAKNATAGLGDVLGNISDKGKVLRGELLAKVGHEGHERERS